MSLSILTNTSAMDTHRNLLASSNSVSTAMQRLSSGLRINSAADDAAGYAISAGLTAQTNGLDQAGRNVGDAISMVQTADSALNGIQNMLQRVRELTVQAQNGSLQQSDQTAIQSEVDQLTNEIDREVKSVSFNGTNLLDGTANSVNGTAGTVTFQVGANASDTLGVDFGTGLEVNMGITGWGSPKVFDVTTGTTLSAIDSAINAVSAQAATLGAAQNRLQYTSDAISATEQNLAASNSRIKDVDMASEMTTLTQQQVLQQAGTAMLAQANSQPQMILKLITG
jgi:flagellin